MLTVNEHTILYQEMVGDELIVVKENSEYRWLEYGGPSVQSLMKKSAPTELLTPVFQSLLFFLLIKEGPLKILSLGLGGASIERALEAMSDFSLTSVDASHTMIELAEQYFLLPSTVNVICQQAEQFVEHATTQYDVVLCDLFIGEKSPDCLFSEAFYHQLHQITSVDAVVMINLQADTEAQLIKALLAIKKHFHFTVLFEFDDYSNITIAASSAEIPNKVALQKRLINAQSSPFVGLDNIIEKMHFLFEPTVNKS